MESSTEQPTSNKQESITLSPKAVTDLRAYIHELSRRASAVSENEHRNSYAPWYKFLTINLVQEDGCTYATVSDLTGVPVRTVEKFKTFSETIIIAKEEMGTTVAAVAKAWNEAPISARATLDTFWSFFGRHRPDLRVSYEEIRQALIDLGLRYPRGPKIKNEGTQVQKRFKAQALWGGDGKHLKIRING